MQDDNVVVDDIRTWDLARIVDRTRQLAELTEEATLVINPIIYAEVSIRFERIEELDVALPEAEFKRHIEEFVPRMIPRAAPYSGRRVRVDI